MENPNQLSIPLPRSLDTRVFIHLTVKAKVILVALTTASIEESQTPTPMGSFVYALPDRFNPKEPLSTALFNVEPTIELTTRMAKLIARRTQLPTYVANSMSFASTALGGTVEEELDAFRAVAEVVLARVPGQPNGQTAA